MGRALVICLLLCAVLAAPAAADGGLRATVGAREVDLSFAALPKPSALTRDGRVLATLPKGATKYADHAVVPGGRYSYALSGGRAEGELPAYLVGAASEDITPAGPVNLGGFGLGDGSVVPNAIIGRGGFDESKGEH